MLEDHLTLIAICAIAAYVTRIGGHLILIRFGQIHYRVEAALDAVPTAVLAALIAPSLVTNGPAETLAIAVAAYATSRFTMSLGVAAGLVALVVLRNVI